MSANRRNRSVTLALFCDWWRSCLDSLSVYHFIEELSENSGYVRLFVPVLEWSEQIWPEEGCFIYIDVDKEADSYSDIELEIGTHRTEYRMLLSDDFNTLLGVNIS